MYQNIFEKTAEWQMDRLGKFTSSEIHKLKQKGRAKADYFGETALTYIKGRLAEIITQEHVTNLEGLTAIEWGNSQEVAAVSEFERAYNLKVKYFGKANPTFIPYPKLPEWAGGSPDVFVGDDAVAEVKCPYNSTHHVTHLLIASAEDLKTEKPDYYGQLQFNMLCSGRKKGFFISYDPRVLKVENQLHVLEVPFDQEYCDDLEERIGEAVKMLRVYLDCINPPVVTLIRDQEVNATIVQ